MFTLTKGKQIEPERPLKRVEKTGDRRASKAPPPSPGANKTNPSPKSPAKGQTSATNKQEKAAKKAQAKATAAAAK